LLNPRHLNLLQVFGTLHLFDRSYTLFLFYRSTGELYETEIQKVISSTIIVKPLFTGKRKRKELPQGRNGVAVSSTKAIVAMGKKFKTGQSVQVIDIHGNTKDGILGFISYDSDPIKGYDVALVELTGSQAFGSYIPLRTPPSLELRDELC
jgi:hypothetical protein